MEKTSDDLLNEFEENHSGHLHALVVDVFREHSLKSTDSIAESIKTALEDKYQSRQKPDNLEE